jgi:hypothetical protein
MERKYTKHQVLRSARPDAEKFNVMYLVKNATRLRATYQIRLLAFRAVSSKMKLVLSVPAQCEFSPSLVELLKTCGNTVMREDR